MGSKHDDYTVAWICALPLEMAATKIMLDKVHPALPQPETDHNAYTLGSIGSHNVVVACLPSGVYGTTSAAIVMAHMLPTFPSLRFSLMVGIGGGVPNRNTDIRLGDVIVSMPTETSGGVIQYDHGKTLCDGRLHCTASLNKPPQYLLTAISQIRSDTMAEDSRIKGNIAEVLHQHQESHEQFSRPTKDWLFKSSYDHRSKILDCSLCDQSHLVVRAPRETVEPTIHYGLIASGNQVMKDARTRDSIANEIDILCFEMEAAGLMDQFPCLVIRGVCDYCDSHKNKEWQGYAALTAAAYARALLEVIPLRSRGQNNGKSGCWMVPFARNLRFVGRKQEIARLNEALTQENGPPKITIYGLGGIGKTQIALETAYQVRERDSSCSIFWVACATYENIEQGYMGIAQKIGLQVNPEEAKEQVKAHLSQESAGKWLLVFDNADDIDMWIKDSPTTPALRGFLPQSQQGCILFTTRNRTLALKLASSLLITVPELDQETGLQMLDKSLLNYHQSIKNKDAVILLEQLAFLPLAITQATAYINENGISISMYSKLLGNQETQMIELLSEEFEDEHRYETIQNPVTTTWWISFQQIQRLNQLAIDYLSFMACINPRDIPLSLLPPPMSENEGTKAIGLLNAYSFVTRQADTASLTLHRLVWLATRTWLRKSQELTHQIMKAADHFSAVFPGGKPENRRLWREYLPHGLSLSREHYFQREQKRYTALLQRIAVCLDQDGRYKEAEELEVQVLEIQKQALGPEHPDTLISMANLALTYWNQGQWRKAEELGVQVLEIQKQVLGPEHPDTLTSMANLASTYWNQGQLKKAEELEVQVLAIQKQVLAPEHPDTLISMANLALTYWNQGQWKKAEELGVQVLEIRKQVLGPEHPDTLTSMANLAHTLKSQAKVQDALALLKECAQLQNKVLGQNHPDVRTSFNILRDWETAETRLPAQRSDLLDSASDSDAIVRI
ncbi:violaceus kinesin [Aspergillus cavernicola]|uniref:Violaceus kinesin n=1 Tax=Aspergillus cavernicola TaxID=176166 RepID=A0ABR4J3U5_9EURO